MRTVLAQLRLVVRLLREPRVPLLTKAVPILAAVYVVSPIDVLPDMLPGLGQIDDLTLMLIALAVFLRLCPAATVAFHRAAIDQGRRYSPMPMAGDVVDAEWRRE